MKPVTQPSNQPFPVQVEIEPATEAVMPATVEGVEPEDAKEQAENNAGNSNGPESTRSERLEQKETGEDSGKEESEQEVSGEKVAQQSSNGRVESVEQPRSSGYSIYSPATN